MTGLGPSCGACKFLRRKCTKGCIFAPYFCSEQGMHHFAAVHKVFGASNVSKLLSHLPIHHRSEAATTISYEALARMRDPVYGCTAHILALQQQVANLQEQMEFLEYQVANFTNGLSHQSSQATNETDNWFPIYSQVDAIGTQHSLYQQPHQPSHTSNTTGNVLLASEMNARYPPIYTPEYQYSYCYSYNEPNSVGRFYMEMEQEILPGGLDDTPNTAYY
ncbi:LOB domain-containing protein 33-like [Macadamia integrifolia]|uniref:LOB domain-containing protein 33-like n=1 Tax=Macadamia integrifolia TaxID=60698 RepID=UPI001C52C118|nr:LOB domain-containing protein 33-like [Macadamia integrifolia]